MSGNTDNPPVTKPRRLRGWLVVLGLLLLTAALWWWMSPRTYRVVARYATVDDEVRGSLAGFLIREKDYRFVLRDWQGKERWQVTAPKPHFDYPYHKNAPQSLWRPNGMHSLSPSGQYFAVAVTGGKGRVLRIWRDGKLIGKHDLPIWDKWIWVRVLDDSRVFIWGKTANPCNGYVLEGDKVIAQGKLPFGGCPGPDGKALIRKRAIRGKDGFEYATLSITGKKLESSQRQAYACSLGSDEKICWATIEEAALGSGGMVQADGALFGPNGQIAKTANWEQLKFTPDGEYIIQFRSTDRQIRMINPRMASRWQFTIPKGEIYWGLATQDGRHAIVNTDSTTAFQLVQLVNGIPILDRIIPYYPERYERYVLYDQSTKAIAAITYEQIESRGMQECSTAGFAFSPDGRAMIVSGKQSTDITRIILFRY